MVTLNDYLYSGDTVIKILNKYSTDLKESALKNHNKIDLFHYNYLLQLREILEHNDFLTDQSGRVCEFYKYMVSEYPELAFTFKGRIKSLIRAEEKFNGYIVEFIHKYYEKNNCFPDANELKEKLSFFRDLIAYRFVISVPKCHINEGEEREDVELRYLYKIANDLPEFMEERGFLMEKSGMNPKYVSDMINPEFRANYRDFVKFPGSSGYQSLHVTFNDCQSRCYFEIQLRTKRMDDDAEIGKANHTKYEKGQEQDRVNRELIKEGECPFFDDAYNRLVLLQTLDLSKIDVNMFGAVNNSLINDGCGLFRGRLITPFEHLSRFQNDLI